ncbi:outer membrane biogenesis protein BamB [Stratiformator vulcanicus]|uniref:Outer membrane biogenesis protein BamB n=2 Tax=Stratiformator vulcanicus TaxID=2527980 RepID=A0A517R1X9_9PLAN|nr:outer membrane biogenesis protein BamB [Stratiformator vulcanicus]
MGENSKQSPNDDPLTPAQGVERDLTAKRELTANKGAKAAQPLELAKKKFRWKPGAIIFLFGAAVLATIWFAGDWLFDSDTTVRGFALVVAGSTVCFALLLWWLFRSGLTWKSRIVGLLLVAGVLAGLKYSVRIEQFDGAMIPARVAWAWTPTAEQRAMAHFDEVGKRITESKTFELVVDGNDWPQFRGPRRDGDVRDVMLDPDWKMNPPKELWRHPVGLGWGSFAVVDDLAFTQEQRGPEEVVVAYESETGRQVWTYRVESRFTEAVGGDGPRATPTFDRGELFTLGAEGHLCCLDATNGREKWSRNILEDAAAPESEDPVENIEWGMAGSPLVTDDAVFVNPGGEQGRGVIRYDRATGEIVWANGNARASYTAPRIETLRGVEQLLIFDGAGISSFDPADGTLLWEYPWVNMPKVNAIQPIVSEDGTQVFISCSYGIGSALLNVAVEGGEWVVEPDYETSRLKIKFSDAIFRDGFLYAFDEAILACHDFETGQREWKKGRYGYGQVIAIGDHLLVQQEDPGDLALVAINPDKFEEVATFPALSGKTWNNPAFANGRLYCRNSEEAVCFELTVIDQSPEAAEELPELGEE